MRYCSPQNSDHADTSHSWCHSLARSNGRVGRYHSPTVAQPDAAQHWYATVCTMSAGTDIPADAWQDIDQAGLRKRKNDVAAYQYFSAGRISIAPPRRAAGTRAATLIAASTFSASRTKYPPTAPRTST